MSSFDAAAWADTTPDFETSSPPPPGLYEALLHDGKAFTSKNGNDLLILTWRIASGPNAGHEWDAMNGFGSDGARKVAKATLVKVGIDADAIRSLDEMDTAVKGACGDWYVVEVKQNGEYVNTYVNAKIEQPSGGDVPADTSDFQPAAVAAGGSDDSDGSIPF